MRCHFNAVVVVVFVVVSAVDVADIFAFHCPGRQNLVLQTE